MNPIIMPVVLGLDMTRRCLASCWAQDIPGGVRVIAIDNASTDGVGTWLRTQAFVRDDLHVITMPDRTNLHRIWNDMLKMCFDTLYYEHALVINNDIEMRPCLYRYLYNDHTPFVTGVSVEDWRQHTADPRSRSPHPSFSCFLIRRDVWNRVGPFDEDYYVYCGDAEYHLRMDRAGIDASSLSIQFSHEVSGTIKHATNIDRDMIQQLADADRETFKRKNGFAVGSDEYYRQFRHHLDNRMAKTGRLDG